MFQLLCFDCRKDLQPKFMLLPVVDHLLITFLAVAANDLFAFTESSNLKLPSMLCGPCNLFETISTGYWVAIVMIMYLFYWMNK